MSLLLTMTFNRCFLTSTALSAIHRMKGSSFEAASTKVSSSPSALANWVICALLSSRVGSDKT